uniref:ABC-type multidrug transport system ATPase n=1 Tax=Rathayibacter toxicus TaxID=145458 RepID=A0A5P5X6V1_9MICO|nr:ABC-type multidrug transport system ATPase [Rathayibacter toxicus]
MISICSRNADGSVSRHNVGVRGWGVETGTSVFRLTDVSQRYERSGKNAVVIPDLSVPQNKMIALLGRNGSGKTTLTKLLAGIIAPTTGRIECYGTRLRPSHIWPSQVVAYMPQSIGVFNSLTGKESLALAARLRGFRRDAVRKETERVVELLECRHLLSRMASSMSGGELRLLQFAVSLIGDLPIMLLDEPSNHLDAQRRQRVWEVLAGLRHQGKTVIVVTHTPRETSSLFDQVLVMREGRIVSRNTAAELARLTRAWIRVEIGPVTADVIQLIQELSTERKPLSVVAGNISTTVDRGALSTLVSRIEDRDITHFVVRSISIEDIYDAFS